MKISFSHNCNPAHIALKQYSPCFGLNLKTYIFHIYTDVHYCTVDTLPGQTHTHRQTDIQHIVYINLQLVHFQHIYVLIVWLLLNFLKLILQKMDIQIYFYFPKLGIFLFLSFGFGFVTGSHYVALRGIRITEIPLIQLLNCRDQRCVPPYTVKTEDIVHHNYLSILICLMMQIHITLFKEHMIGGIAKL